MDRESVWMREFVSCSVRVRERERETGRHTERQKRRERGEKLTNVNDHTSHSHE